MTIQTIMKSITTDISFQIMEFLPVPVQFNVCKTTRHRSKIRAIAAARKIRRSIKYNRVRLFKSVFLNEYTDDIQRALIGLFLSPLQIDKLLSHILRRGDDDYKQSPMIMCLDDRNCVAYPEDLKDSIVLGDCLGWTKKKTLRIAVAKMDYLDLNSLRLCLDLY